MPEVTFDESCRQIRAIKDHVREREKAKGWDEAFAGLDELLDHPCAHHRVAAYDVWAEIHEARLGSGRVHRCLRCIGVVERPVIGFRGESYLGRIRVWRSFRSACRTLSWKTCVVLLEGTSAPL